MESHYVKIKEADDVSLFIYRPWTDLCACGEEGHFEDVNTGNNLGRECRNYITFHDEEGKRLSAPVTDNVRWVRD